MAVMLRTVLMGVVLVAVLAPVDMMRVVAMVVNVWSLITVLMGVVLMLVTLALLLLLMASPIRAVLITTLTAMLTAMAITTAMATQHRSSLLSYSASPACA
jgi:hypothetical protein